MKRIDRFTKNSKGGLLLVEIVKSKLITVFLLLAVFLFAALPALAATIDLPKTGQTISYASGDDGDIQSGVAWPEPRFEDNGDGTVTDRLTGLVWAQDAGTPTVNVCTGGKKSWGNALNYIACLNSNNYLGRNDWRLPNINEIEGLINCSETNPAAWLNNQGFSNVQSYYYNSSTTFALDSNHELMADMAVGSVLEGNKGLASGYYVWPVRAGQHDSLDSTYPANIWKTGQTVSYAAGDDGDLQRGVTWPSPRFIDNDNEMVTDNLTGLIWTKDANAPGPSICNPGVDPTWQEALDYVACLNTNSFLGYNDWRLPNRKELYSLIDFSNYAPALPSSHSFTNVQSNHYWSSTSTTYLSNADSAWIIYMLYGFVYRDTKGFPGTYVCNVWPVRGGTLTDIDTTPPSLSITSHSDGQHVTTSSITLVGTASDAGLVDNGIQQVTVNGSRADNDTAIGSGTANWSKLVNLNAGANTITIIAYDNSSNHNQTSQTITIYYDQPMPDISVSPALLKFGEVIIGSISTPQTVTIYNTGTTNLVISLINIIGADTGMFSVTIGGPNPCPSLKPTIVPGNDCTVNVTFSPTSKAQKIAALSVSSNDTDEDPVGVSLSGVGKIVKLTRPNGQEIWKSGTTERITWQTMSEPPTPVAKFRLHYTKDGGNTWKIIATPLGNPGWYDWKVLTVLSTKKRCKVKVVLLDSLGRIIGTDVSDKVFTIQP
jgi:hypothetical protein